MQTFRVPRVVHTILVNAERCARHGIWQGLVHEFGCTVWRVLGTLISYSMDPKSSLYLEIGIMISHRRLIILCPSSLAHFGQTLPNSRTPMVQAGWGRQPHFG